MNEIQETPPESENSGILGPQQPLHLGLRPSEARHSLDLWVQPLGPHGRLRRELLKVCHLLQQDDRGEVSQISVRALYRECRAALALEVLGGSSSIRPTRGATGGSKKRAKRATRDSKGNKI